MFKKPPIPARIPPQKVAEILGFMPYEVSILLRVRLLKPLGNPAPNGHKFFCTKEILELANSRDWLDKATRTLAKHFRDKSKRHVVNDELNPALEIAQQFNSK